MTSIDRSPPFVPEDADAVLQSAVCDGAFEVLARAASGIQLRPRTERPALTSAPLRKALREASAAG